jgi:hypothetical protein
MDNQEKLEKFLSSTNKTDRHVQYTCTWHIVENRMEMKTTISVIWTDMRLYEADDVAT